MDRNMYKAVGADAHPMIRFRASDLRARHLGGNRYDVHASGQLTMAGKSRDIDVHGAGSLQDGNFHFEGTRDLLLSDYGVQPPVLLMGAIKVADRVVVHFDLTVGNP
jgi:polyisoprenoid-binding protein YceI